MPNTYVIIGVLLLLLAGAGKFGYNQTKSLGKAEATIEERNLEITKKQATITQLTSENSEIIKKAHDYQAEIQVIRQEKAELQQKAVKDLGRVEKIATTKPEIYKKLINKDYENTQKELRELTK